MSWLAILCTVIIALAIGVLLAKSLIKAEGKRHRNGKGRHRSRGKVNGGRDE